MGWGDWGHWGGTGDRERGDRVQCVELLPGQVELYVMEGSSNGTWVVRGQDIVCGERSGSSMRADYTSSVGGTG